MKLQISFIVEEVEYKITKVEKKITMMVEDKVMKNSEIKMR